MVTVSNTGFGTLAVPWSRMVRQQAAVDNATNYSSVNEIWMCQVGPTPSAGTVVATRTAGNVDQLMYLLALHVQNASVPTTPNVATAHAITHTGAPGGSAGHNVDDGTGSGFAPDRHRPDPSV